MQFTEGESKEIETKRSERANRPEQIPAILSSTESLASDTRWVADLNSFHRAMQEGAVGGTANADVEACRVLAAIGSYEEWAHKEFRTCA